MVGKWHLCPTVEMNVASTRRNWPSGRGFERWYGFLGAETNQWYPDLVYDNHPVDQPKSPDEGYHLTEDLTDKAIEFIKDAKAVAPDKPFFLYYAPGAAHAPHHVSKEWADKFKGRFDMGYEAMREQTLARQKQMGIVPADTELPAGQSDRHARDPHRGPTVSRSRRWTSPGRGIRCRREEKRLFAPDGRGVRGVPGARRPSHRPAAGLPGGVRAAGEHHGRPGVGQRGQRRGRPGRVGQREQDVQRHPRRHRRRTWRCSTSSAGPRPTTTTPTAGRWPSTRRSRCGSGTSSTAAPPTRASSPGPRPRRGRQGRAAAPIPPRDRHRADHPGHAGRRAAGRRSRVTCRAASTA